MNHQAYTTYFRTIAEKHVDIQHSPANVHFARIILSGDPFRNVYIEELLNLQRSKIRFPLMLLESYDADYDDLKSDHIWKVYNGAFLLLEKPKKDDFNDQELIIDKVEQIGEEILGYIKHDMRRSLAQREQFAINPSSFTSEKVGPICNEFYGIRFDFSFRVAANAQLKFNPAKFS